MEPAGPDQGFAWVVVCCCAYANFALFGLFRSAGVIYVALLQEYNITREEASWPFTLCSAVCQIFGPLSTVLAQYTTLRKLSILGAAIATVGVAACFFAEDILWINTWYGVVHGFGFGIVVICIPVIINQYFDKYRATAMGCSFAGSTLSSIVYPPAIEYLFREYGLQGTFLLLSGGVLNVLVACSFLRTPPWLQKEPTVVKSIKNSDEKSKTTFSSHHPRQDQTKPSAPESEQFLPHATKTEIVIVPSSKPAETFVHQSTKAEIVATILETLCNPMFYLLTISAMVFFMGTYTFFIVIVDFAIDKGISEEYAIYLFSIFAVTDLVGRIALGWVTDRNYIAKKTMLMLELGIIGGVCICYPMCRTFLWFAVVAAIHGQAVGSTITLIFVLQAEYFGLKKQMYSSGLGAFFAAFVNLARPPMIGLFRDKIGSYDWMFGSIGILHIMIVLLWFTEPCMIKKHKQKMERQLELLNNGKNGTS